MHGRMYFCLRSTQAEPYYVAIYVLAPMPSEPYYLPVYCCTNGTELAWQCVQIVVWVDNGTFFSLLGYVSSGH
jgi:hypothetical protein